MPKYTNEEALRCIDDRKSYTERTWSEKRDLWEEIYSLYRFYSSVSDEVARGERSNIFVPIVFSIIETKLPRIIQALLSYDPFFKVEGRTERDQRNAQFMSDVMQFQMNDEINAFFPLMMWWKECLMYGNSYIYVGWDKETANLKRRVPITFGGAEIIGYDYQMQKETVYDGPVLQPLDIFDCWPAPSGTRINGRPSERMPYFILRSEPSVQQLKSMAETGALDKEGVNKLLKQFPQGYGFLDREREKRMTYNRMESVQTYDTFAPRYEMFTMFENDWWVSEVGGVLLRNKENPFGDNKIPVVPAYDTPVPHEHNAIGQIEPVIKLQYYGNDIENLKLDFYMKSINPGALISQEAFLDPTAFQQNPDGIHVVRGNPNAAYAILDRANRNITGATNEQLNVERLIDKTLGQSDYSRGVSKAGSETATEVVSLIEQANYRFDLSIRLLKYESLVPMLEMMAERNVMFFPAEKEIRKYKSNGEPVFMNVPVSRVIGEYRFKIVTNPVQGNKLAYAQTLLRYLDVVAKTGGQYPKLTKEVAKALGIDNPDELLANPAQRVFDLIVQAYQEGLLTKPQQAALILGEVLKIVTPKEMQPKQGSIPGPMPQPQGTQDMVQQEAQLMTQGAMG